MQPSISAQRFQIASITTIVLWHFATVAFAHDVSTSDQSFVQSLDGAAFIPMLYLGAKHMVTGYDHILFVIGVVFYLERLKDVVLFATLFTLGHSLTLIVGTYFGFRVNAHLIDAVIGLSVIYKGLDNLGWVQKAGIAIDARIAVLIFGLFHGLGLATRLLDLYPSPKDLLVNLSGFNLGVEIGQVFVLAVIVALLNSWRKKKSFMSFSKASNWTIVLLGTCLVFYQISEVLKNV